MIENLMTVFYMMIMLGIVIVCNTVLGIVMANKSQKFDIKKLFNGIGKAILITLCILLFCVTLELVPAILGRLGIEVPQDIITLVEVVLITLTAYKKYAVDVIDKFKTILEIKESE